MDTTTKRLAIHSDFHVEHSGHGPHLRPRIGSADLLVVAGDISPPCYQLMKKGRHGALAWLRQATGFDGPIVFVMGNNDFNHYPYDEVIDCLRAEAQEYDVHFLHNEVAIVEGIEFIGTPLFTNMSLPLVDTKDIAKSMKMKLSAFNHKRFERDYCVCMRSPFCAAEHWQGESYPRGTLLADGNRGGRDWFANEHDKAMDFLRGALGKPAHGPRIVVSHWAPSLRSIVPEEWPLEPKHAYWASDQEDVVAQGNVWIHGHVHASPHYRVGNDPHFGLVISNCHGTPEALFANTHYSSQGQLVIEWSQSDPTRPKVSWC